MIFEVIVSNCNREMWGASLCIGNATPREDPFHVGLGPSQIREMPISCPKAKRPFTRKLKALGSVVYEETKTDAIVGRNPLQQAHSCLTSPCHETLMVNRCFFFCCLRSTHTVLLNNCWYCCYCWLISTNYLALCASTTALCLFLVHIFHGHLLNGNPAGICSY